MILVCASLGFGIESCKKLIDKLNCKSSCFYYLLQKQKAKVRKRESKCNPLATEADGKKETVVEEAVVSSSEISAEDDGHYAAPSMTAHHDDTTTLKSDGLEDLWKDMYVAMECSKVLCSSNFSSHMFVLLIFFVTFLVTSFLM